MTNKFGSLTATAVAVETYRVEIIDAVTDVVLRDKSGKAAYIDVLAADGDVGRAFDKEQRAVMFRKARKSRNGMIEDDDQLEQNIAKCARLTKGWYLVDPETRAPLNVPCTEENAAELYGAPNMGWLFMQPWTAANNAANFIKRSAKTSTTSPSTPSEAAAS
ncbi:MAG: hypothetical protein M9932_04150 [Xanthobacteraceae bacterium]|nr:hypothetical protein [Xanthobacteraceae bacterium]